MYEVKAEEGRQENKKESARAVYVDEEEEYEGKVYEQEQEQEASGEAGGKCMVRSLQVPGYSSWRVEGEHKT